ncbi:MAG TPA: sensor histidine kinase KdpD [Tepidisphaeraceae bacterium]|nr:sensor histidine kinase KdpD [Tepidisphaeraceae bacterium]
MTQRTLDPHRPDPDELLAEVQQKERKAVRGKVKVFFGAAPGVGKTFAMLEEGRARAAEGMDVVVGYAEPHARTDTEALLLGMEILRYQFVDYKNVRLKEFDLDAALERRPALLLIDELAHTNAPGMRHSKRWQDVAEVLGAGIDVYTTLNVQHLESVNDIVERITGVKVRETLPDSVLEQADDVELIDIAPDELLQRIEEGKVYAPEMAERASRNFFSKGNLLALRELALRRTADRVDAQMQDFRRENRVRETWAATERLLVCVSPSPLSARLVRAAKRLATSLRAPWVAIYVERPALRLSQADRDRVTQTLRLAAQLGAETVTLGGRSVSEEVLSFARERNVTKIVIGKPERPRWREAIFGSAVEEIIRGSGAIDIYVIRALAEEAAGPPGERPKAPSVQWPPYVWSAAVVGACTGLAWCATTAFHRAVGSPNGDPSSGELINLVMAYLLAVVIVATRLGRGPAIMASVLSVAAFDFFFVPPKFTFAVSDWRYLPTFGVVLAVAIIISSLTDRVREQALASRDRERRTAALLRLSRDLAAIRGKGNLLKAAVRHVAEVFDCQVIMLLPGPLSHLTPREAKSDDYAMDDRELAVAQWAFDHDQAAGLGTATLPGARAIYLPLTASRGTAGVLGVCPKNPQRLADPEQMRLIEAFTSQAALAIERASLAEEAQQAWVQVEAEMMRNTLLSSVSHDLRTPLAAIEGAASSLVETGTALSEDLRHQLAETIYDESERMDRLINNLLDMTRLESGGLRVRKEWQPLQEVIGSALHHLEKRLRGREVKVSLAPDLPLVPIDAISIEQVLANLLDNAAEYTPPGSPIEVRGARAEGAVAVEISDRGPGLPPGTERRVFQKFFRAVPEGVDGARRGIGLGLAICRGIVEAHGGVISAENREGGGARFRFTIPVDGTPPPVDARG